MIGHARRLSDKLSNKNELKIIPNKFHKIRNSPSLSFAQNTDLIKPLMQNCGQVILLFVRCYHETKLLVA